MRFLTKRLTINGIEQTSRSNILKLNNLFFLRLSVLPFLVCPKGNILFWWLSARSQPLCQKFFTLVAHFRIILRPFQRRHWPVVKSYLLLTVAFALFFEPSGVIAACLPRPTRCSHPLIFYAIRRGCFLSSNWAFHSCRCLSCQSSEPIFFSTFLSPPPFTFSCVFHFSVISSRQITARSNIARGNKEMTVSNTTKTNPELQGMEKTSTKQYGPCETLFLRNSRKHIMCNA